MSKVMARIISFLRVIFWVPDPIKENKKKLLFLICSYWKIYNHSDILHNLLGSSFDKSNSEGVVSTLGLNIITITLI